LSPEKPVIRGTRVPVSLVVGSLAGGMGFEEVEREYGLSRAWIHRNSKMGVTQAGAHLTFLHPPQNAGVVRRNGSHPGV
jgi:hypothetical protein